MRCNLNDITFVHNLLTDNSILPYIIEDGFTDKMKNEMAYTLLNNKNIYVLSPSINSIFVLVPHNFTTCVGHVNILPKGRGCKGIKDEKKAIDWIFTNTKYQKIIGWTPESYKHVIRFHKLCGFKYEGCNQSCVLKDGELQNEVLLGITKGNWIKEK